MHAPQQIAGRGEIPQLCARMHACALAVTKFPLASGRHTWERKEKGTWEREEKGTRQRGRSRSAQPQCTQQLLQYPCWEDHCDPKTELLSSPSQERPFAHIPLMLLRSLHDQILREKGVANCWIALSLFPSAVPRAHAGIRASLRQLHCEDETES
jgi:hypothetical protein